MKMRIYSHSRSILACSTVQRIASSAFVGAPVNLQSQVRPPFRNLLSGPRPFAASPIRAMATPPSTTEAPPASKTATCAKLQGLRKLMSECNGGQGIAAFIIPSEDAHQSEYAPACDARRQFLTNFTGSAGTALVTHNQALLWTDGRYFLQAETELGLDWTLMRAGTPGTPDVADWLAATLPPGARVGIDPHLHTLDGARKLAATLEKAGKALVPLVNDSNLVDAVWAAERPPQPTADLRVHAAEFAGEAASEKIRRMREQAAQSGATALLVTMLDEVCWLLNLRGSDVAYNPVFISYAIVREDGATLYVDRSKLTPAVKQHLQLAGVEVKDYEEMVPDVKRLAAAPGAKIMVDPARVSLALAEAAMEAFEATTRSAGTVGSRGKKRKSLDMGSRGKGLAGDSMDSDAGGAAPPPRTSVLVEGMSPVQVAKAIKNSAELAGMHEAHVRDGVALAEFFCWLEDQVRAGVKLTEVDVGENLLRFRHKQPGFIEPSFPTIAGSGPNGAVIHYRAHEGPTNRTVTPQEMLLIDSGGQYDCGTTDVTRTVHYGEPTIHERKAFTAVLRGHIALDQAVFPEGTPGFMLDSFARQALWRMGLNYRHGTGHGVGAALNVHEGPISVSPRFHITHPLSAGMVVSNEPGYYEDGRFGIRIENLVAIKAADTPFRFGGQDYYAFHRLTLHPIQKSLMALEDMTAEDIAWVNKYHSEVYDMIAPRVADVRVREWLKEACEPIRK